ncbi:MAG: 4Fe-4S binding protein [Dethiobacter sp.]|jgi:Fe-S-cluster-containing hydrogenase component 2|nr:4Fe-4S binding protein [Dethiobacter sp.]MCL4463432.1 4Fe-4S binding protein [Bacillota bacterium]
MNTYAINLTRCDSAPGCRVKKECPANAVIQLDGNYYIDMNTCRGCGLCVKACPRGAVEEIIS